VSTEGVHIQNGAYLHLSPIYRVVLVGEFPVFREELSSAYRAPTLL